jgi:hypothetical protein
MERDRLSSLLSIAVVGSALLTSGMCYWYLQLTRQLGNVQFQVGLINRNRALLQSFAAEATEYGRRNPAIIPILQNIGVRPGGEAAPESGTVAPQP